VAGFHAVPGGSKWRFTNAAVDRLIPSNEDGPGGLELQVQQFIDRQMNTDTDMAACGTCTAPSTSMLISRSATSSDTPARLLARFNSGRRQGVAGLDTSLFQIESIDPSFWSRWPTTLLGRSGTHRDGVFARHSTVRELPRISRRLACLSIVDDAMRFSDSAP
jgi:hypothetical protein